MWVSESLGGSGTLTLIAGILCLFFALKFLVDVLKVVFSPSAERILHTTVFRSALLAMLAGVAITVLVQSSSITTSVVIPLVGAGVITLEQLFPLTIGANIGTTVTAMLAALATGSPAAVTVAFAHLLFNLTATLAIYPIRWIRNIPLALARRMGELAAHNRGLAVAYILVLFYGFPILLLFLTGAFRSSGD